MWKSALMLKYREFEDAQRAIHEFILEASISTKNLEYAREIILKSSHIQFNQSLAFRLLDLAIDLKHEQYVNDLIHQLPNPMALESGELIWKALTTWNTRIASLLVKAGAEVNVRKPNDPMRLTLLQYVAIRRNNREEYYNFGLLLLDHGAEVNVTNKRGSTALHYAVTPGKQPNKYSLVFAVELLRRGARADIANASNTTAVQIAMKNFWFGGQLCAWVIALAEVDELVKWEWTIDALIVMAKEKRHRSLAGMRSLLELGYPVVKLDAAFPILWKPLFFSLAYRKNEQLEILLEHGLNANMELHYLGERVLALHLALYNNLWDSVGVLIRRGADVRATIDASKEQPIHWACASASIENVRLLLRLGVDINVFDKSGKTPYAMIDSSSLCDHLRECLIEEFAILKEKGININRGDWKSINEQPRMLRYYKRCLDELKRMKSIIINNDVSLLCVLVENVEKLMGYARNDRFSENFRKNKQRIEAVFPLYYRRLEYKVRMTETLRDSLVSKEEALSDMLNLPYLVITKIVRYASLDYLKNFEKLYHVSMMKA